MRQTLMIVFAITSLAGCSAGQTPAAPPSSAAAGPTKIIAYSEHAKTLMTNNGQDYMNAAARANQNVPMKAKVGSVFVDEQEAVWIDGTPFTGLQVILQGPAFQQGLLGPPRECRAEVRKDPGGSVIQNMTVAFQPAGPGSFRAQFPDISAQRAINFHMSAPAINDGSSEFSVMITGTKGNAIAHTVTREITVMPKSKLPSDYGTTGSASK